MHLIHPSAPEFGMARYSWGLVAGALLAAAPLLAPAASAQQAPAESAAITIDRDSRLFLNQQAIDKTALSEALRRQLAKNPEMLVIINADDGVQHGQVVEVMDIARGANVAKMAIAVKPKEQKQ